MLTTEGLGQHVMSFSAPLGLPSSLNTSQVLADDLIHCKVKKDITLKKKTGKKKQQQMNQIHFLNFNDAYTLLWWNACEFLNPKF